jgi:hypothetical protein
LIQRIRATYAMLAGHGNSIGLISRERRAVALQSRHGLALSLTAK